MIRQKRVSDTRKCSELISNNDIFVHPINSLSLQIVDVPMELIICACTTLQNMIHLVRTDFGDYKSTYNWDTWVAPINYPPQLLGQETRLS